MEERVVRRVVKEQPVETAAPNAIEMSHEKFARFIEEQIERMKNALLFKDREPSMYELQSSLAQWETVWFGLVSLYETARWEWQAAKEKFDEWWAFKYMEIRHRENTVAVKRNTWLSATEIENSVRSENASEIRSMRAEILEAEGRMDTMKHLMAGWSTYQFLLGQLSRNSIAEIQGSIKHIDVNLDPEDPQ
jgi:hypothetical protein